MLNVLAILRKRRQPHSVCFVVASTLLEIADVILSDLVKYLTKDGNKVVNILPLLNAAYMEIARRPSIAEDTGTPQRASTHLLQRFLNKMTGHAEIAGQLATLALLRFPATLYSHEFWYVHIRPALASVVKVHNNMSNSILEYHSNAYDLSIDTTSRNVSILEVGDLQDCDLQVGFNPTHAGLDDEDEESSREIVRAANGIVLTTTQEEHYKYRSSVLEFMSLYVYAGVVVVVAKNDGSNQTSSTPREQSTSRTPGGRRRNATFDFDPRHPLFATHTQRLRSKHFVPILAGAPPPRHPGSRRDEASWRQAADRFAAYVLTLHMPWDLQLGAPKYKLCYDTLERWTYDLSISRNFLSLATLFWIRVLAQGMSVTAKTLATTSQYRSRFAKHWGATDHASFNFEEGSKRIDDDEDKSLATAVLNDMIAVYANIAPAAEKTAAMLNAERVLRDLAVMDAGLSLPKSVSPLLPGRHDIASVDVVENIYASWARRVPELVVGNTVSQTSLLPATVNNGTHFHPPAISIAPVPHFKAAQNTALIQCLNWFIQDIAHTADPQCPAPPPLHLHISGAAGTGKTTFVKELDERLGGAASSRVICVAPTGIAANALPRGMTIHTAFSIAVASDAKARSTTKGAAIIARDRFKHTRVIVIDEISMVSASLLVTVDARLRDWFEGTLPFGGLAVILMGDFFQLPAIQGSLLSISSSSPAGLIFGLFQRLDFNDQCRAADDPEHAARLQYFRNLELSQTPIQASKVLEHLKLLSQDDVEHDPEWLDAPVIVSENVTRHYVNKAQLVRDAQRTGQAVLTWRNALDPRSLSLFEHAASIHNQPVAALLERFPETSSFFLTGAPVMLRDNIMTEKGISNGTVCFLHSITFDPSLGRATIDAEFDRIAQAAPGTILELKYVPLCVNVQLKVDYHAWNPAETLDQTQVVIPLLLNKKHPREFKTLGRKAASVASSASNKTRKLAYYDFGFELSYAVTYHKVQGQTLSKVILDLNGCNTAAVSLPALYVGLSRVRHGNDIRILPMSQDTRHRLLGMRFSKSLTRWWRGASDNGKPRDAEFDSV